MLLHQAAAFTFPALTFPVLMALAGAHDLLTMTIPNRLVLALAAGFVLLWPFSCLDAEGVAAHAACGAATLAAGFVLFHRGFIGGGDAKLLAAGALWLGWDRLPAFLTQTILLNAALAVLLATLRASPLLRSGLPPPWRAETRGATPAGAAIAAAALSLYSSSPWLAGCVMSP